MQKVSRIHVAKGQILQRSGQLNTKAYEVVQGLLRSYSIDEKGKEHIFMFGPEGWIVADTCSIDEVSELYIDALEDSEVLVREKQIQPEDFDNLKLIKRVQVLQGRVIRLMSASALERYEHFLATYPQIVQRVPQRMIASYLGITPEALSKVKKEYWEGRNS